MPNVASMKCSNVCAHGMTRTMSWQLEQKQDWKRYAACGMNSVCGMCHSTAGFTGASRVLLATIVS